MEPLKIDATAKTPLIHFDHANGTLELRGRSTPEDSIGFYEPIMSWLDTYLKSPNPKTTVDVQFEYFNTSSSKCILDIFKKVVQLHKAGVKVVVNWHCDAEDEDMQEAGEDYSDILELPFEIIKIS